jgi:hypothetical protein
MSALTILRHKQLDVGIQVNGDHQHYSLGELNVDLYWDEDSQFLTLHLSPWAAERLLLELMARLPEFHKDKG